MFLYREPSAYDVSSKSSYIAVRSFFCCPNTFSPILSATILTRVSVTPCFSDSLLVRNILRSVVFSGKVSVALPLSSV